MNIFIDTPKQRQNVQNHNLVLRYIMFVVIKDIGGRPYMEDTSIASEKFLHNLDLYCVFDGHGGDFVANFLRDNYENILKEIIRENNASISDMLFMSIHETVRRLPKEQAFRCGSTFLVGLRYGEVLYIANAGDCRVIMNTSGGVRAITTDHKPDLPREQNRIKQTGGFVSPGSQWDVPRVNGFLAVSRSLGDIHLYPHVTWVPDIYIVRIKEDNKYLVMASDGLWDTMSNADVVETYNKHIAQTRGVITKESLSRASEECIMKARLKGSADNITICAIAL